MEYWRRTRLLKKSLPSMQERELALDRVLQRLQSESTSQQETGAQEVFPPAKKPKSLDSPVVVPIRLHRNIWRISVAVAAVALVVSASAVLIRNVVFLKTAGAMAEVLD